MREQVGPLDVWALHALPQYRNMHKQFQITQKQSLKFSECERPQISKIVVENSQEGPVFLHEGLIVEGLRQTRMVAFDAIINAHSTQFIETVCVEQGRWSDEFDGHLIERAPISVVAALRKKPSHSVGDITSYRQNSVWHSVERHQSRTQNMQTTSLSHMVKTYSDNKTYLPFIRPDEYKPKSNQCGFVIGQGGEPLLMETFGSSWLFEQNFKSIIESVLWDLDDFGVTAIGNRSTINFLEEMFSIQSAITTATVNEFRNGLSMKATSEPNKKKLLHSLVINHNHPIFN